MESALTSKGQITIPKAVRDHLHLKGGDKVRFFYHPDGHVAILPEVPISALKGMLVPKSGIHVSVEDMNETIEAGATEEFNAGTESHS